MADPHTDDLADRLDEGREVIDHTVQTYDHIMPLLRREALYEVTDDLRAAAAELRRLRHRDAALTTLLDAVGDVGELRWWAEKLDYNDSIGETLRRIAAAVEGIDP